MDEENENGLPGNHVSLPPRVKKPMSGTNIAVIVVVAVAACITVLSVVQSSRSVPASDSTSTVLITPPPAAALPTGYVRPAAAPQDNQWYIVDPNTGECKNNQGPAEMMQTFKKAGLPYEVIDDVVEYGKPIQVRLQVRDGVEAMQAVFYRGKDRCQDQADKKKRATSEELNRYK